MSWLEFYKVDKSAWQVRYLYSIYYVCISLNTVGYGDIVARNDRERIFATVFVFLACGIFAYCISSIGVFLQEISKENEDYWKDIGIANRFMKKNNISFDIKARVNKYIEYLWYESKDQQVSEENEIINKLSTSLKEELIYHSRENILARFPIFTKEFSKECLTKVAQIINDTKVPPNEVVFNKGDIGNEKIFLIHEGEINLIAENSSGASQTILKTLHKDEIFGEVSFFTSESRSSTAKSSNFASLYYICRDDFLEILKNFPQDYEKYCLLRDEILLYNNYGKLQMKCFACRESNHVATSCPLLHQIPSKITVLIKYNYSKDQERAEFDRNMARK